MTDRPFRFGIVAGQAKDLDSWTGMAKRTEELGYDTFLATDPVMSADPAHPHDPLTVLAAAAAVTTDLRIGTFVLADPFRDRRMVAWQTASLSALSGGRFELGIGVGRPGAGPHAQSLDRPFDRAGRRLDELAETIAYLKRTPDRPRLLLAGVGPKMLALAAREADTVTMAWQPTTTAPEAKSIVDQFRAAAGARVDEIELATNLVAVGDEPVPWLKKFAGIDAGELAANGAVTVLPGTPAQAADTLHQWRDQLGISYITVNSAFMEQFAPVVEMVRGK